MKIVKLQEYNGTSYFICVTRKSFFHKTVFLIKLQLMFIYIYYVKATLIWVSDKNTLLGLFYIKYIDFFTQEYKIREHKTVLINVILRLNIWIIYMTTNWS